eukprot:CAMPEP_0113490248 /NCGR_PEP_ID=MMETSP0014_2-20120614/26947_1 /TAXON_ID=2857 /ORGANISM="Nitzschia sp." /LENGTH=177 /DNA_ID=CAMNT_0000384011 /DNA_START=37 /DNA_END=570 /DNA_ORIENTATION=+ /assembly_acc=CAM_ASM_000159
MSDAGSVTVVNPIEWAIRICESIAFSLHCIIGLTESCHGAMRHVTENSINNGCLSNDVFFGLAGLFLGTIAVMNFSSNDDIVLGVQCYIVAFHAGAVFTHLRVGHHPVVAAVPGVFVVMAIAVLAIRTNMVVAMIGTAVSISVGILLGFVFVKRKEPSSSSSSSQTLLTPNDERFQD